MKAAWQHQRHRVEAQLFSALLTTFLCLVGSSDAKANPTTQLLLSRETPPPSGEFKGVVDLTVEPPFEGAKVAITVDGERITDALTAPYRTTVDFGPRAIEHRIGVTAWSADRKKRVQWRTTVNHGQFALSIKLRPIDAGSGVFEATTTAPQDDPVTKVELWDNGTVVASFDSPPYRFTVPAATLASGYVQATARTKSGEEAADFWSMAGDIHAETLEVRNVPLFVSVVDRNGQTRDDVDRSLFRILDNNAEGKIVDFGKAFDQPIALALLLDASASMAYSMNDATQAAVDFVEHTMKPTDHYMVFGIHGVPRREQDLTNDKDAVKKVLTAMKPAGETALYDAIETAIRSLKDEKSRRAIVVLSDGGDNSSMASFEEVEKTAREAGIPIYFVAYESLESSAATDYDRMKVLAADTGGFVTASEKQSLSAKYREIEKDLRAQFAITYQISDLSKRNEWRKVRVELKSPKLVARTIGGYFAP